MDVTPGPVAAVVGTAGVGTVPEVTAGALCGVPGAAVVTLSVVASRVAWDAGGVGRVAVVAEAGAEVAGPGLVSEVAPVGGAELAGAGREVVWVAGVPLGEPDPGLVLEVQAGAGSVVGAGGEDPGPLVEDVRVWAATGVEVVVGAGDGAVWVGVTAVVREGGDVMRVVMAGEPGERSVAGVAEVGRGGAELEPAATAEVALGAWVARVPAVGAGEEPPEEVPAGLVEREGAGVLWVLVNMDVTPGPVAAVVGTAGVGTVPEVTAGALCGVPGAAVVTLSVVASRVAWDAGGVGRVAVVAEAGAEVAGPGLVSEVAPVGGAELAGAGREVVWVAGVPLGEPDPGLVLEVQAGAGSVVGAGGEDPGPLVEDVRVWAATGVEVVVGAGDGAVWVGVTAVVREGGDVMRVVMAGEPGERSVAGVAEVGRGGAELEPAATAEVALGAWVARVPAVGAGEEPPEEVPAGLVEREGAGVLWVLVNMDVTPGPVAAVVGTAGVGTVPEVTAGALCGVPGAAVVTLSVVASRVAWDAGGVGRVAVVAEAGAEVAGPGLVSEVAPVGGAELAGAGREVVWVAGVPLGEPDPGLVLEVQAGAGSVVGAGGEDPGPLVEDVRVWAATGVEVVAET
ncbi:elastin-like [Sus scrofa]|uniref:elastin-like n=1 Tax=Sus scrofa TaxID=9823 RepID=UPI000A2B6117|nr:elastin-like [Sus scrofa]